MNKSDLVKKIASNLYLRQSFVDKLIDQICIEIGNSLSKEERVYLQKLGAFNVVKRPARKRYNPITGKIDREPARADVTFHESKSLLRKLVKK